MANKGPNTELMTPATLRATRVISKSCYVMLHDVRLTFCSGSPPPQDSRYGAPQEQYPQQPQYGEQRQGQPAYGQSQYGDPNAPPGADPNAPYDPNAPEGERGIMGAIGGGLAGRYAGKQMGGHTFLGMIGGAIAGSKLEDAAKDRYGKNGGSHGHHGHHGSQQGGGSSWGGSGYGGGRY